jgi:Ca2+-binding EF-hand superfamily protein
MKEQREAFSTLDGDNDGFITKNDLKSAIHRIVGHAINSEEAN